MIQLEDQKKIKSNILKGKEIEGWLSELSEDVIHCLLTHMKYNIKDKHDFLEVGTFKGKSANTLQLYNEEKNLFLVDKYDNLSSSNFKMGKNVTYIEDSIFTLLNNNKIINNKYSVIHEDTLHTTFSTKQGLEIANKLLSDNGIFMIDDFDKYSYPVMLSVLKYIESTDLQIFLVDEQKCYCARRKACDFWYEYCKEHLQNDITQIHDDMKTVLTMWEPEYKVACIRKNYDNCNVVNNHFFDYDIYN